MIALSYVTPEGEPMPNPSLEILREVIFEQGENPQGLALYHWDGCGAAYLGWVKYFEQGYSDLNDQPRLIFFFNMPHGFHFIYLPAQGPRLLTYDGSGLQPKVKQYLGGEPYYLPRACFLSRELAWQVVQDFWHSQQPSPAVRWSEEANLGFDVTSPD